MTFIRSTLLSAVTGAFLASAAAAQATRTVGLQCSINPDHFINCNSDTECSSAWRAHLCSAHNMTQYCGSSGSAEPAPDVRKMSTAKVVFLTGISGGLVGGAIGGAAETGKTDEEKAADKANGTPPATVQYAAIGAGIGVVMGLTMKMIAKHSSLPPDSWWQRTQFTRSPSQGYRVRLNVRW